MVGVFGCVERLAHARRMDEFARMLFARVPSTALRMTSFWLGWNPAVKRPGLKPFGGGSIHWPEGQCFYLALLRKAQCTSCVRLRLRGSGCFAHDNGCMGEGSGAEAPFDWEVLFTGLKASASTRLAAQGLMFTESGVSEGKPLGFTREKLRMRECWASKQLGESPGLQAGEYANAKTGLQARGFPNQT
jgi:hypothetical protein